MPKYFPLILLLVLGLLSGISGILGKGMDSVTQRALAQSATPQPQKPCTSSKLEIVSNLEQVKAGEIVELEISSENQEDMKLPFKWSVSSGTIVSGQGTNKISVLTTFDMLVAPSPTPIPKEFFGSIGLGRRSPSPQFQISVNVESRGSESCNFNPISKTVFVGLENRAPNLPPAVDQLNLSPGQITVCKNISPDSSNSSPDRSLVEVTTMASDPENDVLTYNYTVKAGKIIGSGAKVHWDLTGVSPGEYTITASADDGCGVCGKTVTKTVRVSPCSK